MDSVSLVHREETLTVPVLQAINKCSLFQKNVTLTATPYHIQSSVSLSIFQDFISALKGNTINITDTNFTELQRLSKEFGFSEFEVKLSEIRPSLDPKTAEHFDARERIAALEEQTNQHSHAIETLESKVTQLSTDFGRLISEVSALRSAAAGIQTLSESVSVLKTQIPQKLNDPVVEQLSTDFSELRKEVSILKAQIAAMSLTVTSSPAAVPPSQPIMAIPSPNQPPPPSPAPSQPPPVPSFDSRIISDFPEIFAEFRGKQFVILCRGSRDGFKAKEFHRRCDGHANTLTVILDTKGNIFGGGMGIGS
jgi:outer membrane murein-binding lipoprotein Lpp